jgi:hypothetical protein
MATGAAAAHTRQCGWRQWASGRGPNGHCDIFRDRAAAGSRNTCTGPQSHWQRPGSRSGHAVTDDKQWQVAREIEQSCPHWLVLWGCYSRLFWAFPLFQAPKGTIVSAPDRERLVADMHGVEIEQSATSWVPIDSSPAPASRLPRPPSRRRMPWDERAVGPRAGASRPAGMSSPPPVPGPAALGPSVPRAAPPRMPWAAQTEPPPARRNYDPYGYVPDAYEPGPYEPDPYDPDPYDPLSPGWTADGQAGSG